MTMSPHKPFPPEFQVDVSASERLSYRASQRQRKSYYREKVEDLPSITVVAVLIGLTSRRTLFDSVHGIVR